MKKGYSSLILLILFITMGCKSLMRKVYGVENPQIKNISKIQKYLSSEDIDTTKTLVFKNLGAFATATKMEGGLEIPNAYFFNSKGNFVSYKKKAEDCNALIDDFISDMKYIDSLHIDESKNIRSLLGLIQTTSFKEVKTEGDFDMYVIITWATYAGELNEEKAFLWVELLEKISSEGVKIKYYLLNCDFHEHWNMSKDEIKALNL
ncbi:MAG TPA: hypothetical protein VFM70_00285 [Salinimicrobium sp.]|nr:hypothetical protein [Salinimicrobium sp.]